MDEQASAALQGLDYPAHDALALAKLVRDGAVRPRELLEEAIRRAEAHNPALNFIAHKLYDHGRAQIERGLPDGPFAGVPFLEKDLYMHREGLPAGHGSRLYADYRSEVTAELARRHAAAGLVIFGKTTTPEFGLTGTTESLATGATRNPWDQTRSSGGSSGGASSAVAAGVVPLAHASDGGGSIRIPASTCGLFGLKPSRGRLPLGPLRTEGWGGLSTHGAVSRSVRDSAAYLDATHGPELGSRYTAPTPERSFLSEVMREPGRLRIALMLEPISGAPVDPEIIAATHRTAKLCETLGHHVEEASFKLDPQQIGEANFALMATALAVDIDARAAAIGAAVTTDLIEPITFGFYTAGKQTPGTAVAQAQNVVQSAAITIARFMQDYDVILSPTLATPPALIGVHDLNKADFAVWGAAVSAYLPFTGIFNATGQPSMSVPLEQSAAGLPVGMMFTGRYGDEAGLLRLAGQLERAAPWFDRLAPLAREM